MVRRRLRYLLDELTASTTTLVLPSTRAPYPIIRLRRPVACLLPSLAVTASRHEQSAVLVEGKQAVRRLGSASHIHILSSRLLVKTSIIHKKKKLSSDTGVHRVPTRLISPELVASLVEALTYSPVCRPSGSEKNGSLGIRGNGNKRRSFPLPTSHKNLA
ncbi:hypothetical protein GGR52DRAFT_498001 [Hypoxylon sp. FL1284]|nr:hypothetical protein GGR52DRAFT_498001 [Hypoxylon sp. FL1284]